MTAVAAPRTARPHASPALIVAGSLLLLFAVMAVWPGLFTSADPNSCALGRSLERPSLAHPFGFDVFGCDYLAQAVYGTRASLSVAVLVVGATTVVATVLGSVAGFSAGGSTS